VSVSVVWMFVTEIFVGAPPPMCSVQQCSRRWWFFYTYGRSLLTCMVGLFFVLCVLKLFCGIKRSFLDFLHTCSRAFLALTCMKGLFWCFWLGRGRCWHVRRGSFDSFDLEGGAVDMYEGALLILLTCKGVLLHVRDGALLTLYTHMW